MPTAISPPCDEQPREAAETKACPSETGTLIATVLGSSLAFVVGSIINVALPQMQAGFGTDAAGAQWIVNAYLLPLGAFVLLGGALGDRYGRKRFFLVGLLLFIVGTTACALSPSLPVLYAGRAVEGLGAALLAPNSLSIIADTFTGERRGKAVGVWAAAGAIGGAVAPVLGGGIVDAAGWRWAFLIVIPPTLAAGVVAIRSIADTRADRSDRPPLDILGAVTATAGLAALIWGLTVFSNEGLGDGPGWWIFLAGLIGLLLFGLVERAKGGEAMVPLAIFRNRSFSGISLLTLLLYGALGGLLVLLPYVLIRAADYSATAAGLAIMPFPVIIGLFSRRAGALSDRIGIKRMLTIGPGLVAVGFGLFALLMAGEEVSYFGGVLPGLLLVALGMATSVAPLTTAVMNAVHDDRVGVASGINNAISRIAGLVATALLGVVMTGGGDAGALLSGFTAAAWVGAALSVLAAVLAAVMIGERVESD